LATPEWVDEPVARKLMNELAGAISWVREESSLIGWLKVVANV
jgi:hypothetical protein